MVHPLNELKQAKAARNELSKVRKATAGVVTRDELDEILEAFRAEILGELAEALAPIRGALEIDELNSEINEVEAEGELPPAEDQGDGEPLEYAPEVR